MNSHWILRFCTLWSNAAVDSLKLCDLPFGTIVNTTHEYDRDFMRVSYRTSSRTFTGWIYRAYAEVLEHALPHNVVDLGSLATSSPQDAAQYVIYLNQVQFNLCGELSVCAILGVSLPAFLETWKAKPTSRWRQVFQGGKSRTTGIGDLVDMAQLYPCEVATLKEALFDVHAKSLLISPRRVAFYTAQGWQFILGVKIEGVRGELRSSGIPHWVVLQDLVPTGINRALTRLYNPFSNNVEEYSWGELVRSMATPAGILLRPKPEIKLEPSAS